jgi:hypothetical protein
MGVAAPMIVAVIWLLWKMSAPWWVWGVLYLHVGAKLIQAGRR